MCDFFHSYHFTKLCIHFIMIVTTIKYINIKCIILTSKNIGQDLSLLMSDKISSINLIKIDF